MLLVASLKIDGYLGLSNEKLTIVAVHPTDYQVYITTGLKLTNSTLSIYRTLRYPSGNGVYVYGEFILQNSKLEFIGVAPYLNLDTSPGSTIKAYQSSIIGGYVINIIGNSEFVDLYSRPSRLLSFSKAPSQLLRLNHEAPEIGLESRVTTPPYGLIVREAIYINKVLVSVGGKIALVDCDPTIPFEFFIPGSETKAYRIFTFKAQIVDEGGSPIANASYKIYNCFGELVKEGITDSNGFTAEEWLVYEYWYYDSVSRTMKSITYNPHRLVVTKDSVKYQDYKFNITEKFRGIIPIHSFWKGLSWLNKSHYQINENVLIYAKFVDWLDKPVTGLTVNAVITKPDGSKITISLRDDGVYPDEIANDGVYTGVFTSTDLVGTYEVEISSSIYGNQVKAKTYFDVGIIEKKLDGIDKKLDDIDKEIKTPKAKFF